jgi:hypothetical protein
MWATLLFTVSQVLVVVTASAPLVVIAAVHLAYPGEATDPFAPYESFLPGQPVAEHTLQLCHNHVSTNSVGSTITSSQTNSCTPELGRTPRIRSATVALRQGMFRQVWFNTRDVTIGDIARRWGHPRVVGRGPQRFYVRWEGGLRGVIQTPEHAGRFSYLLPVEWLTIGIEPLTPTGAG